jgi:hypothetical protein
MPRKWPRQNWRIASEPYGHWLSAISPVDPKRMGTVPQTPTELPPTATRGATESAVPILQGIVLGFESGNSLVVFEDPGLLH